MYGIYDGVNVIAQFATPMLVRSNDPVFASDTLSLKRDVSKRPAQRWEVETVLAYLAEGAEKLMVNLVTKGSSETTQIITPQNIGVIRRREATVSVTATGLQDGSVITITDPGGLIPMGTFVKFNSQSKVYMLTQDISSAGSVGIYPNLRTSINSEMKYSDDVIMTCYYDVDVIKGMSFIDGVLMDNGTIKLVEDV